MNKFNFKYPDQDGNLTERIVINISVSKNYEGCIDAFNEKSGELRSFNLKKMQNIVDLSTGEFISNPWNFFGVNITPKDRLEAEVFFIIPAVKALKFFTLTTRALGENERQRIRQFIKETANVAAFSDGEIDEWLKALWTTDMYDWRMGKTEGYLEILNSIPLQLRNRCNAYATLISSGSGRKPIDKSIIDRIDLEFSNNPVVRIPVQDEG